MSRSDGEVLHGQDYDRQVGAIIPYTEQVQNTSNGGSVAAIGTAHTVVTPLDAQASKVQTYDRTALAAALATITRVVDTKINLRLPDVLTGLTAVFNKQSGSGTDTQSGVGASAGTSGSLTLSLPARTTSSVSVQPELIPVIRQYWAQDVLATEYDFFLPSGTVSQANIIAALLSKFTVTALAWPVFKPEQLTFVLLGKQVALSVNANAQQHLSWSDSNLTYTYGTGVGKSIDTGTTTRVVTIPPTLHALINISFPTDVTNLSAIAQAGWSAAGVNWPARTATSSETVSSITATVTPTSVSATSPAAIPTTGNYLYHFEVQPYDYAFHHVFCQVVDMSQFA